MEGGRFLRQSQIDLPEERALIEAAKRDLTRFVDLYDRYFDRVYAYVVRRVGDHAETEDLVSDVFHQALANLRKFEWRGAPFSAWLFRIASNKIADRSERLTRQRTIEPSPEIQEADQEDAQDRAKVFVLVRELPEDQRTVLEMRFAEEKSIAEVAAALGKTEGAIKQLQFRGLEKLRARMGGKHD